MRVHVEIRKRKISLIALLRKYKYTSETGAVVTFTGRVRTTEVGKPIQALDFSGYEPMAQKQMEEIARAAGQRWPLESIRIVHRIGRVQVGEIIMFISVEASHRKEALSACHYLIDRLKKVVPIWKTVLME